MFIFTKELNTEKKVKILFTIKSKDTQTPRLEAMVNAKAIHITSMHQQWTSSGCTVRPTFGNTSIVHAKVVWSWLSHCSNPPTIFFLSTLLPSAFSDSMPRTGYLLDSILFAQAPNLQVIPDFLVFFLSTALNPLKLCWSLLLKMCFKFSSSCVFKITFHNHHTSSST